MMPRRRIMRVSSIRRSRFLSSKNLILVQWYSDILIKFRYPDSIGRVPILDGSRGIEPRPREAGACRALSLVLRVSLPWVWQPRRSLAGGRPGARRDHPGCCGRRLEARRVWPVPWEKNGSSTGGHRSVRKRELLFTFTKLLLLLSLLLLWWWWLLLLWLWLWLLLLLWLYKSLDSTLRRNLLFKSFVHFPLNVGWVLP